MEIHSSDITHESTLIYIKRHSETLKDQNIRILNILILMKLKYLKKKFNTSFEKKIPMRLGYIVVIYKISEASCEQIFS